ncbi:class I SAM-dependent methyltransferase [Candidatus Synechococcus calcipolaris G9]|uniref:Class I SAM-dependent methyltransferase n=1 Tax=Candidatus Synechococcus calcipolaris G9 TaxID=1497997 RepID=A0ABT6EZ19_9SYNE|nr:class I SAM-dependent methyltransferase [Candidatus Synechococcus calcipolaris]MDG2990801.1 class I SAM-dependent methyltransferase [Candidatus Synechococcus calcipolaris G9]
MGPLKSIILQTRQRVAKFEAQRITHRLYATEIDDLRAIAHVLQQAFNERLSQDEQEWVTKIEALRTQLNHDLTELTLKDYGAGNPQQKRSHAEMSAGIEAKATISQVCKASKPRFWALILFYLIREFKPTISIELGTCLGISAAYQAAAHSINHQGRIITLEGDPSLAALAEKNLRGLGLDYTQVICGRFQDTFAPILQEHQPIDYAFIDGHHDENATISYFESLIPYLGNKAIIVFDDISWSEGMKQAWLRIKRNENVKFWLDMQKMGICLINHEQIYPVTGETLYSL